MNQTEYTIQTYEKILSGEQKAFSPYFFKRKHRKERTIALIQYLVEEKLGLEPEEALTKLTLEDIKKYELKRILKYVDKPVELSKDDVRHLLWFAYPNLPQPSLKDLTLKVYQDVLDGKRRTFPKNYFLAGGKMGDKRAIICFKHLCEEILSLSGQQIPEAFLGSDGLGLLAEHKLKIIMNIKFFSIIDLLRTAYPGKFDYSNY